MTKEKSTRNPFMKSALNRKGGAMENKQDSKKAVYKLKKMELLDYELEEVEVSYPEVACEDGYVEVEKMDIIFNSIQDILKND